MSTSSKAKQTQLLVAGLAAATVISLLAYYAVSNKSTVIATKPKKKKLDDDDSDVGKQSRSVDFADTSSDATPKKSNETGSKSKMPKKSPTAGEEKQIHSKIEELDKKGKAFFKNKQVRFCRCRPFYG